MADNRPRVLTTTTSLIVSDLARAIAFYAKLGFGEPSIWGEPPCFAMLNRDGFDLMLTVAESPDRVQPNGPHGVWDMYVRVTDARAEATALSAAGVQVTHEPERTFYDMLETEVLDPDGHRICFGSG